MRTNVYASMALAERSKTSSNDNGKDYKFLKSHHYQMLITRRMNLIQEIR